MPQSRLSLLLALEVAPTGRATADRNEAARVDLADVRMPMACNRREAAAGPMLWADYAPEGGVADRLLSQVFQSMGAVRVVSRLCTGQDDAVVASLGDDLERTAARIEIVDHRKNAQFVSSRLCNQRFYPLAHCLL